MQVVFHSNLPGRDESLVSQFLYVYVTAMLCLFFLTWTTAGLRQPEQLYTNQRSYRVSLQSLREARGRS
jgi:hypothetical protein